MIEGRGDDAEQFGQAYRFPYYKPTTLNMVAALSRWATTRISSENKKATMCFLILEEEEVTWTPGEV